MKRLLKAPIILALTFAVFVFSIYCCCFIHPAQASQAQEETPSCHQTEHQKDQSHDNQECGCHKNIVAYNQIEKSSNIDLSQLAFSAVSNNTSISWQLPIQLLNRTFPESPPRFTSAVPLYIKYATFRI